MRPFGDPGSPSRGVTVAAGIVNKVKGGAVHRPGMTPVDGEVLGRAMSSPPPGAGASWLTR